MIAAAGAGSTAIAWLLQAPGASNTLLEALIPYAQTSFVQFIGNTPDHFVSAETASALAARALERAHRLSEGDYPLLGIGCTGSLASLRPKRGAHRVHIAVRGDERSAVYSLELRKGERGRPAEEEVCSRLLLRGLALASGVLPTFSLSLLPGEEVEAEGELSPVADLLAGRISALHLSPSGRMQADTPITGGILPGSFNPLHQGHRALAQAAARILAAPVTFEISLANVDKPPLTETEALRRATQFPGVAPLVLSLAPTFREKSRLFPGCSFVIGYDTAIRVVAPRYYADEADMLAALAEIRDHGCRFLVAGRVQGEQYCSLADADIPEDYRSLFRAIPEAAFRMDISSTAIRARRHSKPAQEAGGSPENQV